MRPTGRDVGGFRLPISKPKAASIETLPVFWSPRLAGVQGPDERFQEKLSAFDSDLRVTWNRHLERWQLWVRDPRVTYHLCAGWRLLFIHNGPNGEHLPLDERLFARVYSCSAVHQGNISGKQYFERIVSEMEREKAASDRAIEQESRDRAGDVWDHAQIKVGYGPSSGSKFTRYHA